jgi:hypothetical protein
MLCGTAASNTSTVRPFELVVIVKECERGESTTRLLLPVTLEEIENALACKSITLITVTITKKPTAIAFFFKKTKSVLCRRSCERQKKNMPTTVTEC